MAERVKLHPETPHIKRVFEIVDLIKRGGVILFPTDSQYALGCEYTNKKGIERIRQIRNLDDDHHLTIICDSLSGTSKFAHISDANFKIMKRLIPGPYTFILPATKEVPKLLVHPKKKTVGIRVPDYNISQEIINELGNPMLAITAKRPEMENGALEKLGREEFLRKFDKFVDVIIDNQQELPSEETTIIDMTGEQAVILRRGLGIKEAEETFIVNGLQLQEA